MIGVSFLSPVRRRSPMADNLASKSARSVAADSASEIISRMRGRSKPARFKRWWSTSPKLLVQRCDDCIHVGAGDSAVAPRKLNGTGDFFVTGKVVT